jgi:hypothetical protein
LNQECQIDSLPQSWSVISGAGDPSRSRQAMESVDRRLVRRDAGLIQLFDPPFDKSPLNPGYIKAYIPGVRENGGQYTHAAIWSAMAFAAMGENERAWELFTLLNPVRHGGTSEQIATYKVEPYVVAADVYAVAPHTGRGGWTWYTGSASWMYRLLVETLLGVNLEGTSCASTPASRRLGELQNPLSLPPDGLSHHHLKPPHPGRKGDPRPILPLTDDLDEHYAVETGNQPPHNLEGKNGMNPRFFPLDPGAAGKRLTMRQSAHE